MSVDPSTFAASDPTLPASPPPGAMAHRAVRGIAWVACQVIFGKLLTLVSQVVLAWLLTREDFALVAKALSAAVISGALADLGIREVLVRRKRRFDRWANPAFWMAAASGLVAAAAILALAPAAAHLYGGSRATDLRNLIFVMAPAAPLSAIGNVFAARLQNRLQFRGMAVIALSVSTGTAMLSIALAGLGLGAISIVLPVPVFAAVRTLAMWALTRPPLRLRPDLRHWRYLAGDGFRMLVIHGIFALSAIGDYLVLAWRHPDDAVATYYFAFNLSMQTVSLLSFSVDAVLFPVLSGIRHDPARQRAGFVRAMRSIAFFGVPIGFLLAALADPGVRAVYQPKWYPAIPVLQALSVGMAFRTIGLPSQSLLLAQGRFGTYLCLVSGNTVLFMTMVTVASVLASDEHAAFAVAFAVASYYVIEGFINPTVALRPLGGGVRDVLGVFAAPVACSMVATATAIAANHFMPSFSGSNWVRLAVGSLVAAAVYVPLTRRAAPAEWADISAQVRQLLRRRRTAAIPPLV